MRIPGAFAAALDGRGPDGLSPADGVSGRDWLDGLPRLLDDLLDGWALRPDGESRWGSCALVLPVRTGDDEPAALKVTWPHLEARAEHLALRAWDGDGAVRLLRADPHRLALLLERLEPTDLTDVWVEEACETVGGLLARLDVPAIARVPRLSAYAARQAAAPDSPAVPHRYTDQARHLAAELAADADVDARLLHTDLHYENVLAAARLPWLAIDPKPMAGERAFEVAPLLWNRADADELGTGPAIRWSLRRRVEVVCEAAGIDEARARAWSVVRVVDWARDQPPGSAASGLAVTILKAMND
ncbi:streptomycin 6-kinase [Lapillicoccus jejuensis]|uniref:Streptomycin 6-kinase n=1 Tax=Lapillicoccus jejuensis TaxID=402171 RepID=A0A542E3Y2_9MICO|nr:streptomycin 6-kinase [Lapillicoccus jejuensis]